MYAILWALFTVIVVGEIISDPWLLRCVLWGGGVAVALAAILVFVLLLN